LNALRVVAAMASFVGCSTNAAVDTNATNEGGLPRETSADAGAPEDGSFDDTASEHPNGDTDAALDASERVDANSSRDSAADVESSPPDSAADAGKRPVVSAFYVATSGSDSNPGTLAAPFASLARAQSAMQGSATIKTTYLRAGRYTIESTLNLSSVDDGETWSTYPGDADQSAVLVAGASTSKIFNLYDSASVENITLSYLTFDGGSSGGSGAAAVFLSGNGNEIRVQSNLFQNNSNQSDFYVYNSDSVYFQGNVSGPNELQPISAHLTDSKMHSHLFFTDNNLSHFSRMGFEIQTNSSGFAFQDVHIDRNVIANTGTGNSAGNIAISFVSGASVLCNTVWGNVISGISGNAEWGLELGTNNTSVEYNSTTNIDAPMFFSAASGSEVENNTLTNWHAGAPYYNYAYNEDGGFNDTQWIGMNDLNGSSVTGWTGEPGASVKPTVCSPSAAFP
jgi:hypothetical protein